MKETGQIRPIKVQPKGSSVWGYVLIILSTLVCTVALLKISFYSGYQQNWEYGVSICAIIFLFSFFVTSYLYFKTPYLFASAYLICLSVFHLGITIPSAFNLFGTISWPKTGLVANWIGLSGWYTVLAISIFGLGYGIAIVTAKKNRPLTRENMQKTLNIVYWDGVGLLIASGLFFFMMILSFGNLLAYSRVDFFRGVGDTRGLGLFMMTFPSAAILLLIGSVGKKRRLFASVVAAVAFLLFLISGYRSAALFPFMIGAVLWVKIGRKIPPYIAVATVAFVLVAIPAVGALRMMGTYEDLKADDLKSSIEDSTLSENFRVTGQTGGLLAHVLRLAPSTDPYRFGMTYFTALKRSVPNILPNMSKSTREDAKENLIYSPEMMVKMSPSDWATYRIDRDKFDKGEGVGFSGIAEPYLNFGLAGVVLFFLFLGIAIGRLEQKNLLLNANLLVFCCAMFWPFMRTVRNDSNNFIKPLIFMLIILFAWRMFSKYVLNAKAYRKYRLKKSVPK